MSSKLIAIYCRTSTDKQTTGLEAQRRSLEDYCRNKGITNYLVFEDSGVSGSKSSRPQLDKLMDEVRIGNIDTVLVYSFSRFARSTQFLINALEEFAKLGVNFISLSENVDLSTALGRAMFTIISAIATLERELIREKVLCGLANAKANGIRLGRKKTLNDALIRELHSKGYKHSEIALLVKCHPSTISKILKVKKS